MVFTFPKIVSVKKKKKKTIRKYYIVCSFI